MSEFLERAEAAKSLAVSKKAEGILEAQRMLAEQDENRERKRQRQQAIVAKMRQDAADAVPYLDLAKTTADITRARNGQENPSRGVLGFIRAVITEVGDDDQSSTTMRGWSLLQREISRVVEMIECDHRLEPRYEHVKTLHVVLAEDGVLYDCTGIRLMQNHQLGAFTVSRGSTATPSSDMQILPIDKISLEHPEIEQQPCVVEWQERLLSYV